MTNTWLLIPPPGQGEPEPKNFEATPEELAEVWATGAPVGWSGFGRRLGTDFAQLSRHFSVAVYEYSLSDHWPLNFVVDRAGRSFPLCGPVLVFKCDDEGSTVDMTIADMEAMLDYVMLSRAGVLTDSAALG